MQADASELSKLRTRWRRWLGNKTAQGLPYWVTLLDSNWTRWCRRVCDNHGLDYVMPWAQAAVKKMYRQCIDVATLEELRSLDNIYAEEKAGL